MIHRKLPRSSCNKKLKAFVLRAKLCSSNCSVKRKRNELLKSIAGITAKEEDEIS